MGTYLGLLMNSEVWVCLTDKQRCLPFELVDRGYDVWVSHSIVYSSPFSYFSCFHPILY